MADLLLGATNIATESSGTVTLQNATLGSTVTGTLGSGITFPAGHVLQVQQFEVTETNALTTTYVNYWENSITLKSASSDVFGWICFQAYTLTSGGAGVQIYRNNAATVTASHTAVWTKNQTDSGAPYSIYYVGGSGYVLSISNIPFKDSLSGFAVNDVLYYGFLARKYDTDNAFIGGDGATEEGFMSLILMEVQK
jgi:hypothetical protein